MQILVTKGTYPLVDNFCIAPRLSSSDLNGHRSTGTCAAEIAALFPPSSEWIKSPSAKRGGRGGCNGWRAYLIGTIRQEGGDGVQALHFNSQPRVMNDSRW
ncbi:hypothetical protein CDAR_535981 [Caerostris darwini]|uniref:Uncharacterized protein n=1 Tax=Caerostris darwini TaxID=1538125 RepID=A0AAV4QTI8_9ARAC|nr:hypothetical protein CDAR_535981 [Caerostris darwini]